MPGVIAEPAPKGADQIETSSAELALKDFACLTAHEIVARSIRRAPSGFITDKPYNAERNETWDLVFDACHSGDSEIVRDWKKTQALRLINNIGTLMLDFVDYGDNGYTRDLIGQPIVDVCNEIEGLGYYSVDLSIDGIRGTEPLAETDMSLLLNFVRAFVKRVDGMFASTFARDAVVAVAYIAFRTPSTQMQIAHAANSVHFTNNAYPSRL